MLSHRQKRHLFGKLHMFKLYYLDVEGHECSCHFEAKSLEHAYEVADKLLPPLCTPLEIHALLPVGR